MGNSAYLLNHDSPEPLEYADERRRELLTAENQIPILWLALFSEANIATIEVPMRTSAGEKVMRQIPTLFATGFAWVNLYQSRKPILNAIISDEYVQYVAEWDAFMRSHLKLPSVQLELAEISMLCEDLTADLHAYLSAFGSNKPGDWLALLDQANLEDAAPYGIRGFPCDVKLDWE